MPQIINLGEFKLDGSDHLFNFGPLAPGAEPPVCYGLFKIPEGTADKTIVISVSQGTVPPGWKRLVLSKTPLDLNGPTTQGITVTNYTKVAGKVQPGDVWYFNILHELPFGGPSVTSPNPVGFRVRCYPPS